VVAVDTNVIVRLIAMDDADQLRRAERTVAERGIFVSQIALLESAWVLGSIHGFDRRWVAQSMLALLKTENVQAELEDWAFWALEQAEQGADLADMLLLVAARDQEAFATFDKRLARKAGAGSPVRVETLA
jgi:predicted nucleic-acid-binding protein